MRVIERKKYRISDEKYNKAVELLIEGKMTYADISQEVGISTNTLQKIREDEYTLEKIRENTDKSIKMAVAKAGQTAIDLLDARSELVRLDAAKFILALSGIQVTDKVDLSQSGKIEIIDDTETI